MYYESWKCLKKYTTLFKLYILLIIPFSFRTCCSSPYTNENFIVFQNSQKSDKQKI